MIHLYTCKYLSETEPEVDYEKIYGDNVKNMKTILKHFNQNMKKKENILNNEIEELKRSNPPISDCDRLLSVPLDCSNG